VLTSAVKSTARLRPSTSASQIVSAPPTTTHMGQESNQANGQSPMRTLLLPTHEHAQQRNGAPSRQNPLLHCPCPGPFPRLRPSPCPARTRPLPQRMRQGCTIPTISIPLCPSPFIPILREPQWRPLIIPLTRFRLTHTHHKCNLEIL
jgi:hypothetical protein